LIDDVEWGYKLQGEKNILSASHFVIYVFYGIPTSNSLSLSLVLSLKLLVFEHSSERERKNEEVKEQSGGE
jgi:hypothetical protein